MIRYESASVRGAPGQKRVATRQGTICPRGRLFVGCWWFCSRHFSSPSVTGSARNSKQVCWISGRTIFHCSQKNSCGNFFNLINFNSVDSVSVSVKLRLAQIHLNKNMFGLPPLREARKKPHSERRRRACLSSPSPLSQALAASRLLRLRVDPLQS